MLHSQTPTFHYVSAANFNPFHAIKVVKWTSLALNEDVSIVGFRDIRLDNINLNCTANSTNIKCCHWFLSWQHSFRHECGLLCDVTRAPYKIHTFLNCLSDSVVVGASGCWSQWSCGQESVWTKLWLPVFLHFFVLFFSSSKKLIHTDMCWSKNIWEWIKHSTWDQSIVSFR